MERTILHCDCNGFFASVECVLHPELRGVPMAVCGNPDNRHGIILAKNELAKACGIVTAETIWQAKEKCPNLVLVMGHHDEYYKFSKRINAIYQEYTEQVEPFSIDESWLDVTASRGLFGDGPTIADTIRERVKRETGVTISVGVSFNKVFAKMGSDYKKPDAVTNITRENFRDILYPLPVAEMLFVGRRAGQTLRGAGIFTIGDLAAADAVLLTHLLGKPGRALWEAANGKDASPVKKVGETRQVQSVGHSVTFKRDLLGLEDIKSGVLALSDRVASRLRKKGLRCQAVQVLIKSPSFHTITRQKQLDRSTNLAKDINRAALELIQAAWSMSAPIRMLAVTGMQVTAFEEGLQLSLLEHAQANAEQEQLETAIDAVRQKFGGDAVQFGTLLDNDLGIGK